MKRSAAKLLILCLLPVLFPVNLSAVETPEEMLFMEIPTVIGVSKQKENINELPMSAYVVSREDIQRWGVQQLYEVLGRVPGYSFYDFDYFGTEGVAVRGLRQIWRVGYSYELMPIFDWGHQVFVPQFYQSIEVARGPAGLAWGSAAEAGLININLRDDLEGKEVIFQSGDNNRIAYSVAYGHKFSDEGDKNGRVFVGYYNGQQGYKDFPASAQFGDSLAVWRTYGQGPGTYSLDALFENDKIKLIVIRMLNAGLSRIPHLSSGNNDALTRRLEERLGAGRDYQNFETLAYRLEYKALRTDDLKIDLYHNYADKLFWVETFFQSRQVQKDIGFNGEWATIPDKLAISFGGDALQEFVSNAPGWQSAWARDEFGFTTRDKGTFLGQIAASNEPPSRNIFFQGKYRINEKMQTILGGRIDWKKDWSPDTLYSGPRFAYIYQPQDKLTLKYLYNDTARRPAANELYNRAQDLKEERLVAHEIVATWDPDDDLKLDCTLVSQKLTDMITQGNVSTTFSKTYNGGTLSTNGIELAANYKVFRKTLLYWNGSFYNMEAKGSANYSAPALSDGSPLFVPKFTSFAGCEVETFDFIKFNAGFRSFMDIAYKEINGSEGKMSVNFMDLTARTKKFMNDSLTLAFIALNALDENKGVPLFGEHSNTKSGLLPAKESRMMVQATLSFK